MHWLRRDSVREWFDSCSKRAIIQVRLDAKAVVWDADRGSSPSRSLRSGVVGWIGTLLSLSPFFLSFIYPYLMLTLVLISNSWLIIYVFFKRTYMSRGLISPSCTTNYGGTLPNLKSRNYDGICQSVTEWSSRMSLCFVVGPRGPSHGHVITNATHKNELMVASYPCNEGRCWTRVSLERPYLKWVKLNVFNIILAIRGSLRIEISKWPTGISTKQIVDKRDGDNAILTKMWGRPPTSFSRQGQLSI